MDTNKFLLVFKNSVLNKLIFNQVTSISSIAGQKHYKWKQLEDYPHILASHNYFEHLKLCLASTKNRKDECKQLTIQMAIRFGDLEMLIYLLDRFKVDLHTIIIPRENVTSDKSPVIFHESCSYLNSILCFALQHRRVDIIKYLTNRFKKYKWNYRNALILAPLSGSLEILMYFVENFPKDNRHVKFENGGIKITVFDSAAYMGRLDMIEYLLEKRLAKVFRYTEVLDLPSSKIFEFAIRGGHLHLVEYLLNNHKSLAFKNEYRVLDSASEFNRFDIVKLLFNHGIKNYSMEFLDYAVKNGNLELLKWSRANTNARLSNNVLSIAALNGDLECLKWLNQNGAEGYSTIPMDNAAKNGHLECFKYLHFNRTEGCSQNAILFALENGHLDVLKWIYDNRTERCSEAVLKDIRISRIDVLEWVLENQPKVFSTKDLEFAVQKGYLDIVQLLCQKKMVECRYEVMNLAATYQHFHIVKWLFESGVISNFQESTVNVATSYGNYEMVQYIMQNSSGIPLSYPVIFCVVHGCLDILKYLTPMITRDTLSHRNHFDLAVDHQNFDILQWLYENLPDCGLITITSFNQAVRNGNLPLAKWIYENINEKKIESIKKYNVFDRDDFVEPLFKQNQYEMIEYLLEILNEIPKSDLEDYKKLLELKYQNSVESLSVINKAILKSSK
ncbi:hypothetical protein PPL_12174 [Heterostelium album PN500]|uniref:Ankyrin repeat protein n=1 Tax=Heterostelium pallidum (strain ATCC 26659 / Pp 5 / PN500) TaxID=670386 RepID=D3BLX0_HETP5|nr:hypothetical protein PPL_12174 [Heterostelium album PN500]EFA77571.1 hypothetical protein PPL_12174 [Heterostelium album PN500]|eukprot:XP_020429699.1 hypothetical protein PPL_12174 [Heterostelium album PN500]